MKSVIVVAAVLSSLGLAACGGEGGAETVDPGFLDSIAPTAVVTGRLFQVDGDGGNRKPVAGSVTLTGKNGAILSDEVGADGTFELRVIPGDYQVGGTAPQPDGGAAQCAAKAGTTTVAADSTTTVDVFCFVQ